MRHIDETDLAARVRRGRPIEQLLSDGSENQIRVIRFIRIDKEKSGKFSATLFEVLDEGNPNFLDVYEFSPLDPDKPYGESYSFFSVEEALEFAITRFKAQANRFVNGGVIQDEYRDKYHSQ